MPRKPSTPIRLPGPGLYVLPEPTAFLAWEPAQGTIPGLLRFQLPDKQILEIPLSRNLLGDLATRLIGHHPGCPKPDCPVKAKETGPEI